MPAKLRSRPKTVSPKSTPDFARNIAQKTRSNGPIRENIHPEHEKHRDQPELPFRVLRTLHVRPSRHF